MKNKSAIIALIILLVCIVIGLILFLCNVISGDFNFRTSMFQGTEKNLIVEKSYDIEEIESLKIKSNLGEIHHLIAKYMVKI